MKAALKRRSAIEPEIGYMKHDGKLGRCYLKGHQGDAMNIILSAAGHNLRKLLNWLRLFMRLLYWQHRVNLMLYQPLRNV